jgi:hypothetical protein
VTGSNDIEKHFATLDARRKQEQTTKDNAQEDQRQKALEQEARAHAVYRSVVEPAIVEAKSFLATKNICLEVISQINLGGRKRTSSSFYLAELGKEHYANEPRTNDYTIYVRDENDVLITHRPHNKGSENIGASIGYKPSEPLTKEHVNEVIKLAMNEWFALSGSEHP